MRAATAALLVGALAVVCIIAMTGCPRPQERAGETTPPTPEEGPEGPGQAGPESPAGEAGAFQWTETPQLADIPEGRVSGMLDGKPFTANTVRLHKSEQKTTLEISDTALESPTDLIVEDTGATLTFTATPGQPFTRVVAMGDEKNLDKETADYHYPLPDEGGPAIVTPSWACALQISEWTLQPDPNNEEIMGSATGKVAICFNDDPKSWVAGTFECVYYQ